MEKQEWSAKKRKVLFAAALIAALLLIAALGVLVGVPLVRFASEPEHFRDWVDARGIWGRLAYIGMVLFQILIALIPGGPFEIVGGYAFGAVEGTLLCLAASTAGSILVFLLVRRFGMRLVGVFFSRDKLNSLRFLRSTPKRDFLFLLIFMLPGTPKDLLSYFAGLTDIRFPVWLLICSFGRIPSIITSIVGGDALGEGNYTYAILVFAVTLAVSGVGLFVYNQICLKHAGKTKKEDTKDPSKEN